MKLLIFFIFSLADYHYNKESYPSFGDIEKLVNVARQEARKDIDEVR